MDDSSSLLIESDKLLSENQAIKVNELTATTNSGILCTTLNITKCFIGAASFELPKAFEQAGVLGSIIGIIFLATASSFSLKRLAQCAHLVPVALRNNGVLTYPAVGREACGALGEAAAWFGVLAMTLGVCGSYFVFISSTMASMTTQSPFFWLMITLAAATMLSWLRHLTALAYTSAFGIAVLLLALVATCLEASRSEQRVDLTDLPMWEIDTYPRFLGNAGFLYLISSAVLPLAQNSQDRAFSGNAVQPDSDAMPTFSRAFDASVVFVTLLNLAFGLFAWKQFGPCGGLAESRPCVRPNVIDNLEVGPLTSSVKGLLCVDLLFTSLVFLFPVTEMIELEVFGAQALADANATAAKTRCSQHFGLWGSSLEWRRNMLRTGLVVTVATVAHAIPSFSLLAGLTGGFGNNILGFVLPPVFYYRLREQRGYWVDPASGQRWRFSEQALLLLIFMFGLAFLLLSTSSFVVAISQPAKANERTTRENR